MKVILTCGPSYEPVDNVRRLTNLSTGRLGVTLANHLTQVGFEVTCFKGEGATHTGELRAAACSSFSTNDDLARKLASLAQTTTFDAVFHAAALCDYRVEKVTQSDGSVAVSPKIASRDGHLHLTLSPATKLLPRLREWFPQARLVGWKYELNGSASDASAKAWRQITEARTDACILNGAAYGPGFAFCQPPGLVEHWNDLQSLCCALEHWLRQPLSMTGPSQTGPSTAVSRPLARGRLESPTRFAVSDGN